jgi:hypothetical protein
VLAAFVSMVLKSLSMNAWEEMLTARRMIHVSQSDGISFAAVASSSMRRHRFALSQIKETYQ